MLKKNRQFVIWEKFRFVFWLRKNSDLHLRKMQTVFILIKIQIYI